MPSVDKNLLFYGDNLTVLRESVADESVDLVYLDPPFNSNADYNVLFKSPSGVESEAQIEAFKDTWSWTLDGAEKAYEEVLSSDYTNAAAMLRAMRQALGENDMMAYLAMMAVRLIELHRVLKPTGSLYLHCDPTASHYLKIILDGIFGGENFRNEVIWKRSHAHSDGRQGAQHFGRISDTILFYVKTDDAPFNVQFTPYDEKYIERDYRRIDSDGRRYRLDNIQGPGGAAKGNPFYEVMGVSRHWRYSREKMNQLIAQGRIIQTKPGAVPQYKRYLDEMPGVALQNIWTDMPGINNRSDELLGYPTQKPVALLERIVAASSNPGDVVLDPFCGCGTAIHAAEKLGRRWIGIDITHLSIALIERRLKDAFPGIEARYTVEGTPKDLAGAVELAKRDKYQFQWWAVGQVGARPYKGKKKGADGGIDGIMYFKADKKTDRACVVSVKGGENLGVGAIRDLIAVLEREKGHAEMGILICAALPTRPMEKEAAAAGFYECEAGKFPRVQIVTLAEIFQGKRPKVPFGFTGGTFKAAAKEDLSETKQDKLF